MSVPKANSKAANNNTALESSTNDSGERQTARLVGEGGGDVVLAGIVRNSSQRIIAALLAAASRCGDAHDWGEMAEYQAIANTLTEQGGLQRYLTPQTMAAGAGAR